MRAAIEGHRFGDQVVHANLLNEVQHSVSKVNLKLGKGSARSLRSAILDGLTTKGWSSEVSLSSDSDITITSVKNKIGLCLQTGNMARMYADLMKLQKMYVDGTIIAGIMIIPSAPCAKKLGSNVANATRLTKELKIFERVITAPLAILALE